MISDMADLDAAEGSLRPDGTRRKVIKVRPGYVAEENVPKYNASERRRDRAARAAHRNEEADRRDTVRPEKARSQGIEPKKPPGGDGLEELTQRLDKLNVEADPGYNNSAKGENITKETSRDSTVSERGRGVPRSGGRGRGRGRGKPKYTLADLENGTVPS